MIDFPKAVNPNPGNFGIVNPEPYSRFVQPRRPRDDGTHWWSPPSWVNRAAWFKACGEVHRDCGGDDPPSEPDPLAPLRATY